jgi:MFS family permease
MQPNSLWSRDFLLALLGYFLLFMSVSLFFIFPLYLEQFEPSKAQVGWIMGVHSLTAIAVRPFSGRVIDRRGGKPLSLAGLGLLIVTLPLFHLVRDAGALPLALRGLTGLGWGISMTAAIAICSDLAPVNRIAHSIGIVGLAGIVGGAAGPLLGEELVHRFGFGGLFNACTIFCVLSFVCMLSTREAVRNATGEKPSAPFSLRSLSLGTLLLLGLMTITHGAVRGSVLYFVALFAQSISVGKVGPFFVAFSAAAILTRLTMGDISDRVGRKRVVFPAALIISGNLFLLSQVRGSSLFLLSGFIAGLGQGLIFPALSTYIIDIMGRRNKGLALSFYLSLFDVGLSCGSPFFGWISDLFGYRWMYVVAGTFMFAVASLFTLRAPAVPQQE